MTSVKSTELPTTITQAYPSVSQGGHFAISDRCGMGVSKAEKDYLVMLRKCLGQVEAKWGNKLFKLLDV